MDKKDVLDIYREQFTFEMDRKKDITAQAQVRFALIATGITMIVYMAKNIELGITPWFLVPFSVMCAVSLILFLLSAIKLTQAFWNNTYSYLPPMDATEKYRKDLAADSQNSGECIEEYFLEEYSACAGENRKTNNFRQEKLSSVVTPLKLAAMSLAVAGTLFILLDLDASSARKVSEISIVELHQAQIKPAEAPEAKP